MAVGPSSNLLSALSQLQGTRPTQPARSPQTAQTAQTTGAAAQAAPTQKASFAAQLGSIGNSIQVAAEQRSTAPAQSQSRPIPTRGGLLGQHVNILV